MAVPLLAAPPSAVSRQVTPSLFTKYPNFCQPFPCQGLAPDTCGYVIERKTREGSRDGSRDRAHSMTHRRHSLQVTKDP